MSQRIPIKIKDADGADATAEFVIDLTQQEIQQADTTWKLHSRRQEQKARSYGVQFHLLQHAHWNWLQKWHHYRGKGFIGIEADNEMQGLIRLDVGNCRLPQSLGKKLIRIDYLATAPWNYLPVVTALGERPSYIQIGSALMAYAILESKNKGLDGRLGLEALPQSEEFYRDRWGMIPHGPPPHHGTLQYFELA